jgi:hypothetical protein
MLVLIALGGLVAAWRWLPERLPPALSAAAVMRIVGVTVPASAPPPRPPAPPESQFDE